MKPILLLTAALLATAAAPSPKPASPDARLKAIIDSEYKWRVEQQGPGEDTPAAKGGLPDVGPAAQAARLARWTAVSRQLAAIDPARLTPKGRIDYLVYKGQIDALLAEQHFRDYEKPLTSDTSFWSDLAGSARESFVREDQYRAYIKTLRDMPRYFDQNIANMRAGLARGFTSPKVTLTGRDIGVAQVVEAPVEQNLYYTPFQKFPSAIPASVQAELRREGAAAVRDAVIPAHQKLLDFLRKEYIPGARTPLAATTLPDGKAYYQSKIREYVTRDLTADEVHAVGLREVAKIRAEMMTVKAQAKFEGDLPAFLNFLRSDPQFYAKTPRELLYHAAWAAKQFDGKAGQYFGHLPRRRFAIVPVPDDLAPFYTGGRGGPGVYLVNTYDLKSRPFYQLTALTLHESAPGHAFQMPLANENKALPPFRRDTYLSAYGEGWALYSEKLGVEMGMYETPYDHFGMLSYQMWRAARLVVDTGIHSMGWTREQAQAFLRDNTALSNHEIETEVDRYIAWPGQALSYYMGELAFLDARARAEKALGPKFNIRAWHDAMLQLGSVPLTVIDQRTDQFIKDGGKGPYPDEE